MDTSGVSPCSPRHDEEEDQDAITPETTTATSVVDSTNAVPNMQRNSKRPRDRDELCRKSKRQRMDASTRYIKPTKPHWHNRLLSEPLKYGFLKQFAVPVDKRVFPVTLAQSQPNISPQMREILADWLVELGADAQFNKHTIHLSMNIVDRFLSIGPFMIVPSRYQLIGVTALFIASKYYEVLFPNLDCCRSYTGDSVTRNEILSCESSILQVLQYNVGNITTYSMLNELLHGCNSDRVVDSLCYLLADLALRNVSMLAYTSDMTACACLTVALYCLNDDEWRYSYHFVQFYGPKFQECVTALFTLYLRFVDSPFFPYTTLYGNANTSRAALLTPWTRNPPSIHSKNTVDIESFESHFARSYKFSDIDILTQES